jgi:hypothetical protein
VGGIVTTVPLPSKAALDAETDQAVMELREKRGALTGFTGDMVTELAQGLVENVREQFGPGHGRLLVATAQWLYACDGAARSLGAPVPGIALAAITGLAGEQLDREDRS